MSIRGVRLEPSQSGRPRIVAWDVVDFAEECDDLQDLSRIGVVNRALAHFRSRHRLDRTLVIASLRGEAAFNRTVVIPAINDESLERILEYEAQQQIPYPLQDVYWDRRVLGIQEDGAIRATLYAIRKNITEDRIRKLARAGFPVDAVQLRPVALHNFCAAEHLLEEGTVVIDVDYAGMQILIHHDDHSWFRVIPTGAVDYVERLKDTLGYDHKQAVLVARGAKLPKDAHAVEACRDAVAQELVDDIARVVEYYVAARPSVKPSGVVLFQSHPAAPILRDLLKDRLRLPVFVPKGFREIEVHPDVVSAGIQEHFPEMVRAVGLALQGLARADVDVHLYPSDLQRPVTRSGFGYVAAAVLLLLLLAFVGWRRHGARASIEADREQLAAALSAGLDKREIEARSGRAEAVRGLSQLAFSDAERAGPLPLLEALYDEVASAAGETIPYVVHVRCGEALGVAKDQAIIVLCALEGANEAMASDALDRVMDAVTARLAGGPLVIKSHALEETWTSGSLEATPPVVGSSAGALRWRFRFRRYLVHLGARS